MGRKYYQIPEEPRQVRLIGIRVEFVCLTKPQSHFGGSCWQKIDLIAIY